MHSGHIPTLIANNPTVNIDEEDIGTIVPYKHVVSKKYTNNEGEPAWVANFVDRVTERVYGMLDKHAIAKKLNTNNEGACLGG